MAKKFSKQTSMRKAATHKATASKPAAAAKAAKAIKPHGTRKSAGKPSNVVAAKASVLGKPGIKKIQGLLKSKTADGVTLGLSLLESLGATHAAYEEVFT